MGMPQQYSAEDIPDALDRLIEAWRDEGEARNQLADYRRANPQPQAPPDLDLGTLQEYHRSRMRYVVGLNQANLRLETALSDYAAARDDVQRFLPEGHRLLYEYQGARVDIAGRFLIQYSGKRLTIEPARY
jgi:hypothetical protein